MAKVDLHPDFRELLASLNSHGVEYLLLGGYAVIYYGYHRVTNDLDIWIAINAANAKKMSKVMQDWAGFSAKEVPAKLFLQRGRIFMFGRPPVRLDILTGPSGVEFETCYERRNMVVFDKIKVPLISLEDLKANKLASGRNKDLADLEYLREDAPASARRRKKK